MASQAESDRPEEMVSEATAGQFGLNIIKVRFQRNWLGFWREYRWFIVLFVVSVFCDAASTTYFMLRDGTTIDEIHPVIYWAAKYLGPWLGPLLGFASKALAGMLVSVYLRRWAAYLFVTATIISFWAAWYNVWGCHYYKAGILQWFP